VMKAKRPRWSVGRWSADNHHKYFAAKQYSRPAGCVFSIVDRSEPQLSRARFIHPCGVVWFVPTAGSPARKAAPGSRDKSHPIKTHTTMLMRASAAKLLRTPPME
jgi:hypothetical protein